MALVPHPTDPDKLVFRALKVPRMFTQEELDAAVAAEREACKEACSRVYYQHIGPQFGEVRYGIAACLDAIGAKGQA